MLVSHLREKTAGQSGWHERLRIGLEAFFKPAVRGAGVHALPGDRRVRRGHRRPAAARRLATGFAEVYRRTNAEARQEDPAIVEIDTQIARAIAGGVDEVLREYVEEGRIEQLPEIVPELLEFVSSNVARRA